MSNVKIGGISPLAITNVTDGSVRWSLCKINNAETLNGYSVENLLNDGGYEVFYGQVSPNIVTGRYSFDTGMIGLVYYTGFGFSFPCPENYNADSAKVLLLCENNISTVSLVNKPWAFCEPYDKLDDKSQPKELVWYSMQNTVFTSGLITGEVLTLYSMIDGYVDSCPYIKYPYIMFIKK